MSYTVSKKRQGVLPMTATALSSAILLASMPAIAQPADGPDNTQKKLATVRVDADAIEPVYKSDTVSSPKFTQPLVDTPQTIAVIKKELLQQQAATTLSEALRNTPGITLLMGENGNTATGDSIFMRGFDTQGSIFVDGIRDLGSISRDTFNTEQVEIAKGPAGVDNGRGAASGYINLSSKLANLNDAISGTVTGGSGDHKRITAEVNQTLGESSAVRVNLLKQDSGIAGRDQVENNLTGLAASLGLGLNGGTRSYFNFLHVEQNNIPDGGIPTVGIDGYYHAAFDPRPSTAFPNGGPQAGVVTQPVDTGNFYGSRSDFDDVKASMFTVRFEHDLNDSVTLRNTSRYGRSVQDYVLTGVLASTFTSGSGANAVAITDPAQWTVARSRQGKDQTNEILTNQTNVIAHFLTGGLEHDLTAGIEFIHESQVNKTLALPAGVSQAAANLYNPSLDDSFQHLVANGQVVEGDTTTAAIYLHDTVTLSPQWQLSAGLRAEHYNTGTQRIVAQGTATPQTIPVGTLVPQSAEASDNLLSWKLGAVYKPVEEGSIYVSYATSQLPPGSANFALTTTDSINANNPNVDPQKGKNIELGTKWNLFDNKLALTAAVFRSTNDNEFVTNPDGSTEAVGERRVEGLELGIAGILVQNWHISTGLSLLDPVITRGNRSEANNGASQTDGGPIQWTPEVSFTLWNSYEFSNGLTLGGGVRYMDSVVTSSLTNADAQSRRSILEVPDYWVVDIMAAYRISRHVNIQLNVYNLADEEYIARVNNAGSRYDAGIPRSARLGLNLQF